MDTNTIIYVVTMVVTIIMGIISKKYTKLNNKLIPIQNLLIGIIVFAIEWFITKEPQTAIIVSGLTAGGTYDIVSNLNKLKGE